MAKRRQNRVADLGTLGLSLVDIGRMFWPWCTHNLYWNVLGQLDQVCLMFILLRKFILEWQVQAQMDAVNLQWCLMDRIGITHLLAFTSPLFLSICLSNIQTYSKPMMACAHEAWLVSWILRQHLTSAMALESVCRGQIFWPAGPTPGKSWGGWFILQNLGSALSCMTKTQFALVCFKGRAKILQFYLALIGTNGELIVYHPDQAICWEIPYTARVENKSLLTALFRPGCLLTWSKKCRVYLVGLDILHALYCDTGICTHDVKANHLLCMIQHPCDVQLQWHVYVARLFQPLCFSHWLFVIRNGRNADAASARNISIRATSSSVLQCLYGPQTFYWNYASLWGTHASCCGWDESPQILEVAQPAYWVCVKATDPKIHRFPSKN